MRFQSVIGRVFVFLAWVSLGTVFLGPAFLNKALAQSDRGTIEARAVFCVAGQRLADAGGAARWNRGGARNCEPGVDDRKQTVVHVSRARHLFAGGRAHGSRRGLDQSRSGHAGEGPGSARIESGEA